MNNETKNILDTAVRTARQIFIPTLEEFLTMANGRARTRTFDDSDYLAFLDAVNGALIAAYNGQPYYVQCHAGSVANAYKYVTSTARWAVLVSPTTLKVEWDVSRPTVGGRHVPCFWSGGERSYMKAFREAREAEAADSAEEAEALDRIAADLAMA